MKTESLDTPTIDEILDMIGHKLKPVEMRGVKFADEIVITGKRKAKQALLQWHKSKARSYVLEVIGDEKSFERMFDGKAIVFEKDGTQYPAIPLYTAVMTLKRYRRTIDQTLKAIEESK